MRIAALTRAERDAQAIALAEQQDDVGPAAFFVAISCHRLGRKDHADEFYQLGVRKLEDNAESEMIHWRPEFLAMQAETERMLGMNEMSHQAKDTARE